MKDSNECTHSGKDDHIASQIAVCRSATVFEYKYEAKQLAKERILRGNQHFSAGKLGARTCIKTGQLESSEGRIVDIRGRHYTTIVIQRTMERNRMLESLPQQTDKKKRVRAQLTSRSDQLRTKRTEVTVELYARAAFDSVNQKPKNLIQKQTYLGYLHL